MQITLYADFMIKLKLTLYETYDFTDKTCIIFLFGFQMSQTRIGILYFNGFKQSFQLTETKEIATPVFILCINVHKLALQLLTLVR